MKTTIAYEVFYFLKVYIFEDLLILNALYQKYIAKRKKNGEKKMVKRKKEDGIFLRKKTEEKQDSAIIMISVD